MREHSGPDRRRSGPRKCNFFAIHFEQLCPKATGFRPGADPQSSPTSAPIAHPPARITLVGNPAVAFAAASPNSSLESRSEEHTSELQSLMRNSYAVFCLKKKTQQRN